MRFKPREVLDVPCTAYNWNSASCLLHAVNHYCNVDLAKHMDIDRRTPVQTAVRSYHGVHVLSDEGSEERAAQPPQGGLPESGNLTATARIFRSRVSVDKIDFVRMLKKWYQMKPRRTG